MLLAESLKIGIREITLHKMRSALTMLGVIFGVAAVISTAAIGAGAREELRRQLSVLGSNTVRIRAVELKGADLASATRKSPFGLTTADARALREVVPGLARIAPVKKVEQPIFAQGRAVTADVIGTTRDLEGILGLRLSRGRFLVASDLAESRQVCVVGEEIRRAAYPLDDPIGKPLLVGGQYFTIVGVLRPRGKSGTGTVIEAGNIDRAAYLPISSVLRRLHKGDRRAEKFDEIILKATGEETLRETSALAKRVLDRRHGGVADFAVVVPEELIRQQQQAKSIFTQVLLFIAAISLLVGGIGIMNIMLATVTQRTREVGVRRALGATRRAIMLQFIVESLMISLVGGVIGIAVGWGLAEGIGQWAKWETIIPLPAVLVAVTMAAAVGFLFGLYPSMKAAALDPIEALRVE